MIPTYPHNPNEASTTDLEEGASVVLKMDASGNLRFNLHLPEDEGARSIAALALLAGLSSVFLKNIPFDPAAQAFLDRTRSEALAQVTPDPVTSPSSVFSKTLH